MEKTGSLSSKTKYQAKLSTVTISISNLLLLASTIRQEKIYKRKPLWTRRSKAVFTLKNIIIYVENSMEPKRATKLINEFSEAAGQY